MTEKTRRTMALTASADDLLTRVGDRSAYVSQLVERNWMRWTAALRALQGAGLKPNEILAACDALNGYWMIGDESRGPAAIALELSDADELNGLSAKWDISRKRWRDVVKRVHGNAALAHSIAVVVEEFWTGNEACEALIRKGAK